MDEYLPFEPPLRDEMYRPSSAQTQHRRAGQEGRSWLLSSLMQCFQELAYQTSVQPIDPHHPVTIDQIRADILVVLLSIDTQENWVVERFQRCKANQSTPVLVMSEKAHQFKIVRPGDDAAPVPQPFTPARFMAAIQQLPAVTYTGHPLRAVIVTETKPQRDSDPPVILLVDDNDTCIQIQNEYLGIMGFRTVLARDGFEAVCKAREVKPDLILMDIQMPRMDGLAAIRGIRKDPGVSHIPIIALTAMAMAEDQQRCLEAGANAYMSKPVSLRKLIELIKTQIHPLRTRG